MLHCSIFIYAARQLLIYILLQSSDDTETEAQKAEERKAEEEGGPKESVPSSKGTSTPSGRLKHTDPSKKTTTLTPRKRLGSPNASDASGTDTSRKRYKNKHISSQASQPASRTVSPPAPASVPVINSGDLCNLVFSY